MISGALYFDVVAATPIFLLLVGGVHIIFPFAAESQALSCGPQIGDVRPRRTLSTAISNLILST